MPDRGGIMNEIEIHIPGVPIAKKRPRFARRGKFVTTYNSQETEEGRWLLGVREAFRKNGLMEPINVPVAIWMIFSMPIPKSATKKQLEAIKVHPKHTKKPDIDNLQKFALDCLNGELFTDDSLVWSINAFKAYHEQPGTYIKVTW